MIAYVDSSVILRIVLGQAGALREWKRIDTAVTSGIAEVECLRTLDRLRLREGVADEAIALRREAVYRLLERAQVVEPRGSVIQRASQPMPTVVGTLDAIHLATALVWREEEGDDLVMATHDAMLATAAKAQGLAVIGV